MTHVFQVGTQISKGRKGTDTLLTKYKIDVRKMKDSPSCNALYVERTVTVFLQSRGIDCCNLGFWTDHGDGWFRCTLSGNRPLRKSDWVETVFHAFPLECLASVMKHGLWPSSLQRLGCRIDHDTPGLYFLKGRTLSAGSYSRFVADTAGIFFRCTMECRADRNKLLTCKKKGQKLQPVGSWATVALWVQAVPYKDIQDGDYIMPAWFPLLEVSV